MAIKNGNPLCKLTTSVKTGHGFQGVVLLPQSDEKLEQDIGRDHPLYDDFAAFGWMTKTRNTIGATPADKRTAEDASARAKAICDAYDEGEWSIRGEGGEAAPSGGIVARAVAEVRQKTVAEVVAHIHGQFASIEDEKARAKAIREAWDILEANPAFTATVKRLREEATAARLAKVHATKGENAKSLLAGL